MQILLLAGGSGTRLWPLSRKQTPKQLLSPFNDEKNLIMQTVDRILAQGVPHKNIHLITTEAQAPLFTPFWEGLGEIICEKAARNTGPAVLLGLKRLQEMNISPSEPIALFPSDHYISDFHFDFSLDCSRSIYCFTLVPTRAETGYGHIQLEGGNGARKVASFKEKPDPATAKAWFQAWVENPSHPENKFWNAGIYLFSLQSLSSALEKSAPKAYTLWHQSSYEDFSKAYESFERIPFDVMIAEKADNLYALPLNCSHWRDIGTWKSVHEALCPQPQGNAAAGKAEITAVQSQGNIAFSTEKKVIVFGGVHNLAVIDTGTALLVADKENPEVMKALLETLDQDRPELI